MKKPSRYLSYVLVASFFSAVGFLLSSEFSERDRLLAKQDNYIDRARICIEAAAMIRNDDASEARRYLESTAIKAMMGGAPDSKTFLDLPSTGKALFVSAQRYQTTFPDSQFDVYPVNGGDRPRVMKVAELVGPIPADHPEVPTAVRLATGG